MMPEEIGLILVVCGVFLMVPVVDWMVRVVGEMLRLFKKFYVCKGKACGNHRMVAAWKFSEGVCYVSD